MGGGSYARTSDQTAKNGPISEPAADKRQSVNYPEFLTVDLSISTEPEFGKAATQSPCHVLLNGLNHYCEFLLTAVRNCDQRGDTDLADGIFEEYQIIDGIRHRLAFNLCLKDVERVLQVSEYIASQKGGLKS